MVDRHAVWEQPTSKRSKGQKGKRAKGPKGQRAKGQKQADDDWKIRSIVDAYGILLHLLWT